MSDDDTDRFLNRIGSWIVDIHVSHVENSKTIFLVFGDV